MKTLTPNQLHDNIDQYIVVDVRNPKEKTYYIDGAICIDQINDQHKHQAILIYCARGVRSMTAAQQLESKGFTDVSSLDGGIFSWLDLGFPVVHI